MSTPIGRRSNLLLITLLLVISILLEQFFIAPILPWLNDLGSIRPMVVFLDIPLALPAIDLVPVSIIFALFYQIAPSAGLTHEHPSLSSAGRVWKALSGWWVLLILLVAGGAVFQLSQDYLPKNISNGIDSFGVRADLTLPYPSGGLIHLHGSVVMLLFSTLGIYLLNRRTATPATAQPHSEQPQAQPLSTSIVSSAGTLISPNINEVFAAQQHQQHQQPEHARYQPPAEPQKKYNPSAIIPGYEKPLTVTSTAAVASPVAKSAAVAKSAPATTIPPASKPTPAPVAKPAPTTIASPASKPAPVTATYVQRPAPRQPAILNPEPPPTCRLTTPPPIAVVMPRAAPGIGKMHPCFVIGGLKPVKIP
ncbi:MAG TPA: hypothetical protein VNW04_18790 [Puia sp.]|nr:hypothetical protein [Puia sp.]